MVKKITLLAIVGIMSTVSVPAAIAGWTPVKPVEFVVMAGKGGGADKAVRLIQSIIAENEMAPVPFTPVNKAGGSGAEALVHVNGRSGNDHTIMFTLNSFYTTPLRQPKLGVDIATFTPIARMAEDTFCCGCTRTEKISITWLILPRQQRPKVKIGSWRELAKTQKITYSLTS